MACRRAAAWRTRGVRCGQASGGALRLLRIELDDRGASPGDARQPAGDTIGAPGGRDFRGACTYPGWRVAYRARSGALRRLSLQRSDSADRRNDGAPQHGGARQDGRAGGARGGLLPRDCRGIDSECRADNRHASLPWNSFTSGASDISTRRQSREQRADRLRAYASASQPRRTMFSGGR